MYVECNYINIMFIAASVSSSKRSLYRNMEHTRYWSVLMILIYWAKNMKTIMRNIKLGKLLLLSRVV